MATFPDPRGWLRREAAVAGALLLGAGLAIWLPRHLPMVDLPEHRAIAASLAGLSNDPPDPAYAPWVHDRGTVALYGALYYRVAALVHAPDTTVRVELTLALFAWVAGAFALAHAAGASRRLAALSVPLFLGPAYTWGFLPWLLALPAIPWTWWAAVQLGRAEPPAQTRRLHRLVVAGVPALAAAMHLGPALLAVGGATIILAPRRLRWTEISRAAGLLLPAAIVPAVVWLVQTSSGRPAVPLPEGPLHWPGVWERLRALADWAAPGPFAWLGGTFALLLLAALAAQALAGRLPSNGPAAGDDDPQRAATRRGRMRLVLVAAALGAACLFLPRQAGDLHFAAERLVAPLSLLLLALPGTAAPSRTSRRTGPPATALWLAAAAGAGMLVTAHLLASLAFADEVGNLDRIAALVPRGSRVLSMPIDGRSEAVPRDAPLYLHQASRVVERRGGVVSIPPLANAGMPLEPTALGLRSLVVPERGEGLADSLLRRIRSWDYVLVYARGGFPGDAFAPLAAHLREVLPPEHGSGPYPGPWFLLRVVP